MKEARPQHKLTYLCLQWGENGLC